MKKISKASKKFDFQTVFKAKNWLKNIQWKKQKLKISIIRTLKKKLNLKFWFWNLIINTVFETKKFYEDIFSKTANILSFFKE